MTFNGVNPSFLKAVLGTDCIKNKCMFYCTCDVIAVLNAAFTKGESTLSNVRDLTTEFDVDDLHDDTHDTAQPTSDVLIILSHQ